LLEGVIRVKVRFMSWTEAGVVVGVVSGLGGLAFGWFGLRQATKANKTADAALEVSKAAEARNDRLAAMEMEHRDVHWSPRQESVPGILTFLNSGTSEAVKVRMVARPEGFPEREHGTVGTSRMDIGPGKPVGMDLRAELEEYLGRSDLPGTDVWGHALPVEVQFFWESPAGKKDSWSTNTSVG
jgi:hypothetical protein